MSGDKRRSAKPELINVMRSPYGEGEHSPYSTSRQSDKSRIKAEVCSAISGETAKAANFAKFAKEKPAAKEKRVAEPLIADCVADENAVAGPLPLPANLLLRFP